MDIYGHVSRENDYITIWFVDLPILKIVIFHSYRSLPEGNLNLWIFMVMSVGKMII